DLNDIYDTLQAYLGSAYVNDLTLFGRNWQVNVQADSQFRLKPAQIGQLKVRNELNEMVPLATLVNVREITGPAMVTHYNLYSAIDVNGDTAPGVSSGQGIRLMNSIAKSQLPKSMGFEWTELT
ncbi:MAG: efflux RND transporter permease subunit, partial [Planctomycetia bacterium]